MRSQLPKLNTCSKSTKTCAMSYLALELSPWLLRVTQFLPSLGSAVMFLRLCRCLNIALLFQCWTSTDSVKTFRRAVINLKLFPVYWNCPFSNWIFMILFNLTNFWDFSLGTLKAQRSSLFLDLQGADGQCGHDAKERGGHAFSTVICDARDQEKVVSQVLLVKT